MIGGVTIWKIIWAGGLPHLNELPHLPGVPHLHVNRPLALQRRRNFQVSKRSALESLNNDQRQTTTATTTEKRQNVSISKTKTFARASGFLVNFLTA